MGAGDRPGLPARPAGVLGGRLRLARAGTVAERLPPLPGQHRRCPRAFRARAGPRRPRDPADLDKWLAELFRRVPAGGAAADGPGRARHRRARFWRGDRVAARPRILRKAGPDGSDMPRYGGAVAPPYVRAW